MHYGSKQLMLHNKKSAKVGDVVSLGPHAQAMLTLGGMPEEAVDSAVLVRRQLDGAWWARVGGEERCIGSGYDWKIQHSAQVSSEAVKGTT